MKLNYRNKSNSKKEALNSMARNSNSYNESISKSNKLLVKKPKSITPFHIYLKDERRKMMKKHGKMSIRDINKSLSERWKKISNRIKQKYEYRSYLAKKRLYKKQGILIRLKKPSFIKRISSNRRQTKNKNQHLSNTSRTK